MSTVLEKAVLTDDTGKQIKGTLEEIRDAITGSGSTHYPVRIQVATPPEKVDYIVGETLDLTGIIVNAIFDNGVPYDVTENCTFDPDDGDTLTAQDTAINVTWTWTLGEVVQTFHASRGINVSTVESIEITTPPDTVDYAAGDTLDLTGMVVKANMSNNTQIDVTSQCTYSPDEGDTLTTSDTTITATLSISGSTFTATQAISVILPIYGVEWDGSSSPAWTRTDSAVDFVDPVPYYAGMAETPSSPFDNKMPWSGMQIIEDSDAGTLVSIPKFYYKISEITPGSGIGMKIQISPIQQTGYHVSPAHMDRGDGEGEREVVYIGRYHCGSSDYKSVSGETPKSQVTRANFRTNIHNLGSDIWQADYAMRFTLWLLYIVEFAHWNSQDKIGYGNGNNSSAGNMGYTDSMPYHTGTTQSSRTAYGLGTQYRNIEGLWDNVFDFMDGCYYNYGLYIILNPTRFSDSSNGTQIWTPSNGFPTAYTVQEVSGLFPTFTPSAAGGSNSTYACDYWAYIASNECLYSGGNYVQDLGSGLFYVACNASVTSDKYRGSRLMKLPSAS